MTFEAYFACYFFGGYVGSLIYQHFVRDKEWKRAIQDAIPMAVFVTVFMLTIHYASVWFSHLKFMGGE